MTALTRFSYKLVLRCSARHLSRYNYLEIEYEAIDQNPPLYYYESRRVVSIKSRIVS